IRLQALLRTLPEESAGFEVKNGFVSRTPVGAHEVPSRNAAVFQRDLSQSIVAGLPCGPENDADIHHDVDAERLRADKRREIATLLLAQCQSADGVDQYFTQVGIVG